MQRRILVIVFIALMLGGLLAACGELVSPQQSATSTPIPMSVQPSKPEYEIRRGEVVEQLSFRARVVPQLEEELVFKTSGYVHRVYFQKDDTVEEGQVIAELEGLEDYQRQLKLQELQVHRAEIHLENAGLALDLFKLNRSPYLPTYPHELQQHENAVSLALIGLEEAKLHLEDLEEVINKSQIVAPFNGKILSIGLREGRQAAGFEPVVVVGDVEHIELRADLNSSQVKDLEVGMGVLIQSAKLPNQTLSGTIRQIPYLATGGTEDSDPSTRIALNMGSGELALEIGDLVTVDVVLDKSEDALLLPLPAIRNFGGRTFVIVQDGAEQRSVDVKLGLEGEGIVEILELENQENLEEGQIIVGP